MSRDHTPRTGRVPHPATVARVTPDQLREAHWHTSLSEPDQPGDYWAAVAIALFEQAEQVYYTHIRQCRLDGTCHTCDALAEQAAITQAFETVESERCPCEVADHFTIFCPGDTE